jgi:hypothetical protein
MKAKPATGKASVKVVKNAVTGRTRKVSYGQKGANVDPGSKRGDSYCARSAKIKGDWKSDKNSPNNLSRKRWKCKGSKSMK